MVAYAEADVKVPLYMVFDSSHHNWIVLFFVYLYHFLVLFFANDRYDDGCHLLGRAMSLIGTCWMAAAVCCLAIFIDKFHITNHTDAWCVGALNPYKFRGIDEANTERSITSHALRWYFCFIYRLDDFYSLVSGEHSSDFVCEANPNPNPRLGRKT